MVYRQNLKWNDSVFLVLKPIINLKIFFATSIQEVIKMAITLSFRYRCFPISPTCYII